MVLWRPTRPSELIYTHTHTHKAVLFIIGDWNENVRSQEVPRVTGKFLLEIKNKAGQSLTVFKLR